MHGLQVVATDGPDSVEFNELPDPPGDALIIDVRAAGVGFPDLLMARGEHQIRQPVPFTLGWEAAGVISSVPEGSRFEPGDEVVTLTLGSFAEKVAAVPEATFLKPAGLSWQQAAAFPMNYLTALAGLQRRGRLEEGETVLVQGAAGGTGTAAIQVAKSLGARVFGVVSSDSKETAARAAGADEVFRSDGPWKDEAIEASGGGVDLVVAADGSRFRWRGRDVHVRLPGRFNVANALAAADGGLAAPGHGRHLGVRAHRMTREPVQVADHRAVERRQPTQQPTKQTTQNPAQHHAKHPMQQPTQNLAPCP